MLEASDIPRLLSAELLDSLEYEALVLVAGDWLLNSWTAARARESDAQRYIGLRHLAAHLPDGIIAKTGQPALLRAITERDATAATILLAAGADGGGRKIMSATIRSLDTNLLVLLTSSSAYKDADRRTEALRTLHSALPENAADELTWPHRTILDRVRQQLMAMPAAAATLSLAHGQRGPRQPELEAGGRGTDAAGEIAEFQYGLVRILVEQGPGALDDAVQANRRRVPVPWPVLLAEAAAENMDEAVFYVLANWSPGRAGTEDFLAALQQALARPPDAGPATRGIGALLGGAAALNNLLIVNLLLAGGDGKRVLAAMQSVVLYLSTSRAMAVLVATLASMPADARPEFARDDVSRMFINVIRPFSMGGERRRDPWEQLRPLLSKTEIASVMSLDAALATALVPAAPATDEQRHLNDEILVNAAWHGLPLTVAAVPGPVTEDVVDYGLMAAARNGHARVVSVLAPRASEPGLTAAMAHTITVAGSIETAEVLLQRLGRDWRPLDSRSPTAAGASTSVLLLAMFRAALAADHVDAARFVATALGLDAVAALDLAMLVQALASGHGRAAEYIIATAPHLRDGVPEHVMAQYILLAAISQPSVLPTMRARLTT